MNTMSFGIGRLDDPGQNRGDSPSMAVMRPDETSAKPPGWETIEELFAALESPLLGYALRYTGEPRWRRTWCRKRS